MSSNGVVDGVSTPECWDRVFRCLASEERRQIVLSLQGAAADAWRALPDAAVSENIDQELGTLRTRLHHVHLPKLADQGYVVWQRTPFQVRRGANFEEASAVLGVLGDNPDRLPARLTRGCASLDGSP